MTKKTSTIAEAKAPAGAQREHFSRAPANAALTSDAKVELFVKYGATQWKGLGGHPIPRLLITQ